MSQVPHELPARKPGPDFELNEREPEVDDVREISVRCVADREGPELITNENVVGLTDEQRMCMLVLFMAEATLIQSKLIAMSAEDNNLPIEVVFDRYTKGVQRAVIEAIEEEKRHKEGDSK